MVASVGRLSAVPLREVWPGEASDFTPWLRANADVLADALGIDLEFTGTEERVGPFIVDVIGRDLTNRSVLIVENQLTRTDHGHLGQLLTYTANTDAATVVWMALSFREEHRQVIEFLNDMAGDKVRFYGVEIGAVRIGESDPAPQFKVIAQPNESHARAARDAEDSSESFGGKGALYAAFWDRFLEQVRERHPEWTRARKGQASNWMNLPAPFKGLITYVVSFPARPSRLRCELYVDAPKPAEVEAAYGALRARREEIEERFGGELEWEPVEDKRASRIAVYTVGDISQADRHDEFIEWFIRSLERLKAALDPFAPKVLASM